MLSNNNDKSGPYVTHFVFIVRFGLRPTGDNKDKVSGSTRDRLPSLTPPRRGAPTTTGTVGLSQKGVVSRRSRNTLDRRGVASSVGVIGHVPVVFGPHQTKVTWSIRLCVERKTSITIQRTVVTITVYITLPWVLGPF